MSKVVDVISEALRHLHDNSEDVDGACKILEGIDECHVKVYRESEDVKLPVYAKDGDACMDVYVHRVENKHDGRICYHTGLHFRLPDDYEMEIRPRSSITKTVAMIQNAPCTLDASFTGELVIVNRDIDLPYNSAVHYNVGDRCAQILVRRRERVAWDEVKTKEELGVTERGDGGFGSTGK